MCGYNSTGIGLGLRLEMQLVTVLYLASLTAELSTTDSKRSTYIFRGLVGSPCCGVCVRHGVVLKDKKAFSRWEMKYRYSLEYSQSAPHKC